MIEFNMRRHRDRNILAKYRSGKCRTTFEGKSSRNERLFLNFTSYANVQYNKREKLNETDSYFYQQEQKYHRHSKNSI